MLPSELVARAEASGQLTPDLRAEDIPMVMCGLCATIDKRKAGWDWQWHLEPILRGMRAET